MLFTVDVYGESHKEEMILCVKVYHKAKSLSTESVLSFFLLTQLAILFIFGEAEEVPCMNWVPTWPYSLPQIWHFLMW